MTEGKSSGEISRSKPDGSSGRNLNGNTHRNKADLQKKSRKVIPALKNTMY